MFSDPQAIIPYLNLREGMCVADFGAGSGHYSLAMARRLAEINPTSNAPGLNKVYAVDVQKELLQRLEKEVKHLGVRNIEVVWGDIEKRGGSKLADGIVDLVLLANTLFQSDQRYSLILEAKRVLKAGGHLAIVEWSSSFGGLGPSADRVVSPEEASKICAQAGLKPAGDFPAGANHYGLLFVK